MHVFVAGFGAAMSCGIALALLPPYLEAEAQHPVPSETNVSPKARNAIEKYTAPYDYVLTTGTPDVYFLTGRLGAHETNGFVDELLVMYPGKTDVERVREMRAMLDRKMPKVVILDSSWSAYADRSGRTIRALVKPFLSDKHYVSIGDGIYVRPDSRQQIGHARPLECAARAWESGSERQDRCRKRTRWVTGRTRGDLLGTLLVTGAPGWLAEGLFASLRADWPAGLRQVRCLVKDALDGFNTEEWRKSQGIDMEVVRGDLTDCDSLRRAVQGVTSVLHGAGIIHVRRIREYYDVNTEGTHALAEVAAAAGVERMVLVSSNAAGGRSSSRDKLLSEDDPSRPLCHYGRSKLLAERTMFSLATPMERVALRPCMFYGPPVPMRHVEVFRRVLHGRMPLIGNGEFSRSLTHVDHIVQASRLALTHPGAVGNTYYVADAAPYTYRSVIEAMAHAVGVEPRWIRVPAFASSVAYDLDALVSHFGRYWQTVHLVGEGNWHVGVSIDHARRDLGYDPPHSAEVGMRVAVEWCRERGLL